MDKHPPALGRAFPVEGLAGVEALRLEAVLRLGRQAGPDQVGLGIVWSWNIIL